MDTRKEISITDYNEFHDSFIIQKKIISENNFTYRILIAEINKYVKKSSKILDIGCGVGTLDFYFANKGNNVLGIDISSNAIRNARKNAEALNQKNAKFEIAKFPDKIQDGKFDFIIFTEVIEHLEDDDRALREIYKLLNKNGIVLISTPSKNAPLHRLGYAKGFDKRVGHLRRYKVKDLVKKCEENGLEVLETKKIEGILRNSLFLSPIAGKFVRFVKFYISDIVTLVDNLTVPIFGESNIIVVARKR